MRLARVCCGRFDVHVHGGGKYTFERLKLRVIKFDNKQRVGNRMVGVLWISQLKGWERALAQLSSSTVRIRHVQMTSLYRAEQQPTKTGTTSEDFFDGDKSVKTLTEEEILAKRNKSRLSPAHFKKINGENPSLVPPGLWFHNTVQYKRKLYAKFGEKTGINPGIQWPTHAELNKRLEYEGVVYPLTIPEMVANVKEKQRLHQEYIDRRTKEIETNVAAIEKTIKEVLDKRAAKEKELLKSQERKEKMMEEVRRHFGYTMDPKDERFQALMEKKEKEEKKRSKEAKKLEREQKTLELLQRKSDEVVKGKTKAPVPPKKVTEDSDD